MITFTHSMWILRATLVLFVFLHCYHSDAFAQLLATPVVEDRVAHLENPAPSAVAKERELIEKIYEPELLLRIEPAQTKIISTRHPIKRTVISHPEIIDMQTFGEREFELIGKAIGETTLTIWFDMPGRGTEVLRYFVRVDNIRQKQRRREARYRELQSRINEMFPNSQVFLLPIEDKVIVRGQARDAEEAAQIMRLLGRGNVSGQWDRGYRSNDDSQRYDAAGDDTTADERNFDQLDADTFVNLMRVPGEQQVMLKVRVAELVRESSRTLGVEMSAILDSFAITHLLSGGGNATAILHDGDVRFFLRAISSHGYGKILAEPTLVTVSGKTARFLAGGEFAVPTTVGVDGVGAATTTFRGFGTELNFTPTVLDKDLIRLQVAPSFSSLNSDATVGGIPGLNRRSVETTVDLREGQWLAIAGLIQDEQGGHRSRLPYLGDLPTLGGLFSTQSASRFETELIVLVSPELVHPLEGSQVPPLLPGTNVTEPTDDDFFIRNMIQGFEGFHYRSTVWPEIKQQSHAVALHDYLHRMSQGVRRKMDIHQAYISGPCGLSE
jgi:pilus assembly protein CpaC